MANKSIMDSLVDSRIIFLNGEVTSELANRVVAELLYLDSLNHEDINIYINSQGGSVIDGLAIIDTMNLVKSKVNTIVVGMAASMAAVISASGYKRYALSHSKLMIHQVYFGAQGTISDVSIVYKNALDTKKIVMDILAKVCHKKSNVIEKDCDRDYWLDACASKEYGLIDEILI